MFWSVFLHLYKSYCRAGDGLIQSCISRKQGMYIRIFVCKHVCVCVGVHVCVCLCIYIYVFFVVVLQNLYHGVFESSLRQFTIESLSHQASD